jgi:ABC-type multidrug transport system permease subunit
MNLTDWLRIAHPVLAVVIVYPLLGIVMYFAWQTRQRRLQTTEVKSKISPLVGLEHVTLGRWLTGAAVGIALLGLVHPIFKTIAKNQVWTKAPGQVIFIVLMFAATIGSLALLYRAKSKIWRMVFAALTSMGLIVLGLQDGVFRRLDEWFVSHYFYGTIVAILMVISLTILPEIYRHLSWRKLHIALNTIALLLFLSQGITGARDLLEIPLSWQEPTVFSCDFAHQTCGTPPKATK